MKLTSTALVLTLFQFLPSTLAQTACTQANALQYDDPNDPCSSTAINRDSTGCVQQYCTQDGTAQSLHVCFCLAGVGSNCGDVKRDVLLDFFEKRQTAFTCSSSETCYINPVDDRLFCLNSATGDYRGESGDSGNINTGAYTEASGPSSTALSTAGTSSGARSSSGRSSSAVSSASQIAAETTSSRTSARSTSATGTGASVSVAVASVSSSVRSSAASAASSTSSAGVSRISAGAAAGVLGLFVGLVL